MSIKHSDWLVILETLDLPVCCQPNFTLLSKRFRVCEEALGSIFSQENQRRLIHSNRRLQDTYPLLQQRYLDGQDFLELCCESNWPPCFLMRRLLEMPPWHMARQKITEALRNPELVHNLNKPDNASQTEWEDRLTRLQQDISTALLCDPGNSPSADITRRETGLLYEAKLCQSLKAAGLAFWTEDDLRSQGFFKTPDAKLQVPFLYKGQVVAWIDSKATFGGEYIHQQQLQEQYQKYVNRYGCGMVIYWFGVIDELVGRSKAILLVSDFPSASEITTLPCLEMPA